MFGIVWPMNAICEGKAHLPFQIVSNLLAEEVFLFLPLVASLVQLQTEPSPPAVLAEQAPDPCLARQMPSPCPCAPCWECQDPPPQHQWGKKIHFSMRLERQRAQPVLCS